MTDKKRRTKLFILGMVGLLASALLACRLYLNVWTLDYVNRVLNELQGYKGSVQSINIDLYRGAYRINKLALYKTDGNIPTPFIAIDQTDLSVQWSALFHGRVVSSVKLIHPVINFAVAKSAKQTGENVDWTKPIKDLAPIDINSVKFADGSVTYQDFSSTPHVNIFIHKMNGEIQNLRNVQNPNNPLPSQVAIAGSSIGDGSLKINGRMNILKQVPDMNLMLALENVNLPALNDYTEAYAAFDFEKGNFSLYSQLTVKDGRVSGYLKPIVTNLSVNVTKKSNPLEVVWSTVVAATLKVFTNISKDQFATKIDLQGTLGSIDTDPWSALGGILRNAFISAMSKGFDQTGQHDLIPETQPPQ